MKILAIDTSSKICTVSILDDDNVLINLYNDDEKTHSVKLMPMVDEAFKKTNLSLKDINLLACCIGPGSFTGVRIGIATIKAFSDTTNIPVVGITSLESLAYNIKSKTSDSTLICSLIDAKHDNVYCGLYNFKENICNKLSIFAENIETTLSKISSIVNRHNFSDILFVGDGSVSYKNIIEAKFNDKLIINFASDSENLQSSISIAHAGVDKYKKRRIWYFQFNLPYLS